MISTAAPIIDGLLHEAVTQQDEANFRRQYSDQDEFVVIPNFLPQAVLEQWEAQLLVMEVLLFLYQEPHCQQERLVHSALTRLH